MDRHADAVLVLTGRLDPTADLVVTELHRRRVPVFRFDLADFPHRLSVTAESDPAGSGVWQTTLRTGTRSVRLDQVRSAWYRRPTTFGTDDTSDSPDGHWAALEARLGLGGLLATVPCWLNHPAQIGHAEYKPVQLAAAAAAGLRTPRTLVTNDPRAAARFVDEVGPAVYKPFSSTTGQEGARRFVYTSVVNATEVADDGVRATAHTFQEWVAKDYEVRLTVVDEVFSAARIDAHSPAARIDWRSDYAALRYAVTDVPLPVRRAVSRLLRSLGLRFAAMDFVVTPAGDWVFVDLNPNGQWGWIEHETGLPICAAIADALERGPAVAADGCNP